VVDNKVEAYSSAILGEKKANKKFQSQFVALPSAIALGLTRSGNDSPRYTQGTGPQKIAKENT